MSAPLIGGRSRGTGANAGDGSNKDADGFSSRADKNGEVRKIKSECVMNYGSCRFPGLIDQPFCVE